MFRTGLAYNGYVYIFEWVKGITLSCIFILDLIIYDICLFLTTPFFSIIDSGTMMNLDFKLEVRLLAREYPYLKFAKDWHFKVTYLKLSRNFKKQKILEYSSWLLTSVNSELLGIHQKLFFYYVVNLNITGEY